MSEFFLTQNGEITFKRKIRAGKKTLYLTIPVELHGKFAIGSAEYQVTLKPLK